MTAIMFVTLTISILLVSNLYSYHYTLCSFRTFLCQVNDFHGWRKFKVLNVTEISSALTRWRTQTYNVTSSEEPVNQGI